MTINKPVRMAALVVIPVLLAGLAGVKVADSRAPQSPSAVSVFIPDQPPVHVVDQAPADDPNTAEPEFSGGDVLLFRDPVLDPDTGQEIGSAVTRVQVVENMVDGDAPFILDCTVRLKDGSLVFSGAEQFANLATTTRFPVVGGTGTYASANGVVTGTPTQVSDRKGMVLSFDLGG